MPFSKPILDEVYPDRLWANNLAVVLRWVDSDKLLKMQDGSIYYLDVDHPYIKPFYKKFGLDIIELTSSSLMSLRLFRQTLLSSSLVQCILLSHLDKSLR